MELATYKEILGRYTITPDTLYVAFSDMGTSAEMLGFHIARSFALSHPGDQGVSTIEKHNKRSLLGCASLSTLRANHAHIQKAPLYDIDKDRFLGLWKSKEFFVMLLPKDAGKEFIHCVRVSAFTAQRVEEWARTMYPQHVVALTGTQEDYIDLLAQMETIVEHQNFDALSCDHRQWFEDAPAHCLLSSKKRPQSIDVHVFVANNWEAA